MNAAGLLQHYERFADALGAVAKLRRLILDLAVRGRLLPQEASDEPAEELIKKNAIEKMRLLDTGKIKRSVADPADIVEAPFAIPCNWAWTRLGLIGDWGSGSTPPRGNSELYGGGIMWLKSGELNDNRGLATSEESVTGIAIAQGSFRMNRPGDILIAMYGATIGKVAILAESAVTNQAVCGCTPFGGVFNQFLFLFLLSYRDKFRLASEGGAQPNISKAKITSTPFALPPLAEQHRIVAKVDELMALCDQLEAARAEREARRDLLMAASLARLNTPDPETFHGDARFALGALPSLTARPDQIKQIRDAILNLAVRGKLVRQDPTDEPSTTLAERAKAAKIQTIAREGLRERTPLLATLRNDLKFDYPVTWEMVTFDDVFVIVSGVTKGQKVAANEAVEAPYLRVANVQRGRLDLSIVKLIVVRESDIQKYGLRTGDVLMTEGGDWDKLGRAAIWRDEIQGCIHQNHVFRVRPASTDIAPEWVVAYTNSPLGRAFFENAAKQTTNLASINLTQLRSCPLPLPPLAEQRRIMAKIDELMALCDRLQASLETSDATRSRLLDALLHEALAPALEMQEAA